MTCKCGKTLTWADTMADDALRPGSSTKGLCKGCRNRFWKEFEGSKEFKKVKEKAEKAN